MSDKSKGIQYKPTDLSNFCKSTFTLTFVVEILGLDIWHDCNEGWLDLGPCVQGMRIQYSLYPGQNYDLDVLIWPHVAKVWCGSEYGYVRTWQFLERRWMAFSIRHAFAVRVNELQTFVATVTSTLGVGALSANAKSDKTFEVYLRSLQFKERRYYAPVFEHEPTLRHFINNMLWSAIEEHIPASYLDGVFDVPGVVTDIRHQDAAIDQVQKIILNYEPSIENETSTIVMDTKTKMGKDSKVQKETDKKQLAPKAKFEILLSGDAILAGTGRVIPFKTVGERPREQGEIKVLLSSNALPAPDDCPVIFVNVEQVYDVPVHTFKELGIVHLYTAWKIGDEYHTSELQNLTENSTITLNDHHAVPLPVPIASAIVASFVENYFEVQLRGRRSIPETARKSATMFGYSKTDHHFGKFAPQLSKPQEEDILIAVTKIDARKLAKGLNTFIRGEYPIYPPTISLVDSERDTMCTNDINAIKRPMKPEIVVQPHIILEAQMSVDMSIGLVGCKTQYLNPCYSRIYCLVDVTELVSVILRVIIDINNDVSTNGTKEEMLTGFAIDTGNVVFIYAEGPRDGSVLHLWNAMGQFYPKVKPVFTSCARYSSRIYEDFLTGDMPFKLIKMFVPLGLLLACPPIYVRPALPLPAKSVVLKLGRLISGKLTTSPYRNELPTTEELNSFSLELGLPQYSNTFLQ